VNQGIAGLPRVDSQLEQRFRIAVISLRALKKRGATIADRAAEAEEIQYFGLLCSSLAKTIKAVAMPPKCAV